MVYACLCSSTGKGLYKYDAPGGKVAYNDPDVADIIISYSKEKGIQRRKIPSQVKHGQGIQT